MDFALSSCSWHGHETYAPEEPALRARLRVDTPAGEAWRCLRCANFVPGPPKASGPADRAPEVPRGRLLRDRVIMRLLAVERLIRALVLILVAAGIFQLRTSKTHAKEAFDNELPLIRPLADQLGWNVDESKLIKTIDDTFALSSTTLTWLALSDRPVGAPRDPARNTSHLRADTTPKASIATRTRLTTRRSIPARGTGGHG